MRSCLVQGEMWAIVENCGESFCCIYQTAIVATHCALGRRDGGELGHHCFYIKTEKKCKLSSESCVCVSPDLFFFSQLPMNAAGRNTSQPWFSPCTPLQIRIEMLPNSVCVQACVCVCVYPSSGLRRVWLGVPNSRALLVRGGGGKKLHFAEAVRVIRTEGGWIQFRKHAGQNGDKTWLFLLLMILFWRKTCVIWMSENV